MFIKLLSYIRRRKFIFFIILLLLAGGGYFAWGKIFKSSGVTSYVLAAVAKETIISSVSGSGQISAVNQLDIKSQGSGAVTAVYVHQGQEIKTGTLLAQLDAQDAQKAVRDAQANLDSARLALAKIEQPADNLSVLQAENALTDAKEAKQNSQDDLDKSYDDGFDTVTNAFLDLSTVMTGLQDTLLGTTLKTDQWNIDYYADAVEKYNDQAGQYRDDAYNAYITARIAYDKNFQDYKLISRDAADSVIEALVGETYDTTKDIAEAVKNSNTFIQFYEDQLTKYNQRPASLADTHLTNLNSYTGKTNSHLSSLLSIKQTIQNDKNAIVSADRTIAEKIESLANLQAGADALDIQSQQLSIKQKEDALQDARAKLADYSARAPFDGIIASVGVKKGDQASASTVVATLITKQQLAAISLNEIDAAKVKLGQPATLTFDAIDGLIIAGRVVQVDTIGTVSQGVVSYSIQIGLDTQDDRIKPGMSVSAAIIVDSRQNVIAVPSGAVKAQGGQNYVQVVNQADVIQSVGATGQTSLSPVTLKNPPTRQAVTTGLSDDTMIEITSGLQEGDIIVTQTIGGTTAAATTTGGSSATQQSRGLIPGMGGSGGAARVLGR